MWISVVRRAEFKNSTAIWVSCAWKQLWPVSLIALWGSWHDFQMAILMDLRETDPSLQDWLHQPLFCQPVLSCPSNSLKVCLSAISPLLQLQQTYVLGSRGTLCCCHWVGCCGNITQQLWAGLCPTVQNSLDCTPVVFAVFFLKNGPKCLWPEWPHAAPVWLLFLSRQTHLR